MSKNGGEVMGESTRTRAASDGNAVGFASLSAFGEVVGTGVHVDYVSVRGAAGWETHAITPAQLPVPSGAVATGRPFYDYEFSEDLTKGVFRAYSPVTDAPNVEHTRNLYLRDDLLTAGAGTYRLLTNSVAAQPIPPLGQGVPTIAGASADFSQIIFESPLNLTEDANGSLLKLYVWEEGVTRLAGILPDEMCGSPPCPAESSAAGRGATGPGQSYTQGTISEDGSRLFFTSPVTASGDFDAGAQIYMRIDDSETVRVSRSEKVPPELVSADAVYDMATPDGGKVLFTSAEQLTTVPGSGLYMYDATRPDDASDNLTLLGAGEIVGVMGASDDGTVVYFIATTQLVSEAPADATPKIYRWQDGALRYVGALEVFPDAIANTFSAVFGIARKPSRVTPDGAYLVFVSHSGVGLAGFDHSDGCLAVFGGECSEVYVYDAEANDGAGELVCASCNPDGAHATTDATSVSRIATGITPPSAHLNHALSEDGRRVFFTSGERLVPADRNGDVRDVYVFDTLTHEVSLISGGRSTSGSFFLDASANGDDVFFTTRDRLVGRDVDDAYDLYDARVGGGFDEPGPPPPPCAGADACRGDADTSGAVSLPGSVRFDGLGNVGNLGLVPVFRVLALHRRQVERWAATGKVALRVQVSEGGRVRASARARLGSAVRRVASASRRVERGGVVRLRLQLTRAARAVLRREGTLRIAITVRFSPVLGAQRAVVKLKRPDDAAFARAGRAER